MKRGGVGERLDGEGLMRQVKTSLSQKFKLIEPDMQKCRDRART